MDFVNYCLSSFVFTRLEFDYVIEWQFFFGGFSTHYSFFNGVEASDGLQEIGIDLVES